MKNIPYNLEAEYRLLGGAMKNVDWANQLFSSLKGMHFFCPKSREIFDLMASLYEANRSITLDTIEALLPNKEAKVDDLVNIYTCGNTSLYIEDSIVQVKDAFFKRELQTIGESLLEESSNKSLSFSDIIRNAESKLFSMSQENTKKIFRTMKEVMNEPKDYLKTIQDRQQRFADGKTTFDGIPTHFYDLDSRIRGFIPGHFTIIGARPGVGKTTFILNLIELLCFKSQASCLFFSLEMPASEVIEKLVSQTTEIPYSKLATGSVTSEEFQAKVVPAAKAWEKKSLIIDDQPSLGIDQVKSRAIRAKKNFNIKVIFIDYIQLITSKGKEARHLEIADISRKCKEIAKELDVSIVALAQLNREVEKRESKTPFVSDLRESGSLEADADEILLLHRPELYDQYSKPGLMEIHVSKNRFGPTGMFYLNFNKQTGSLTNYAP